MFNDKYAKEYFEIIKKDPDKYYNDYQKMLDKRKEYKATYKEEPVPALYQGYFYDENIEEKYQEMAEILMSITQKVTQNYLEDKEYRKEFGFDPLIEKLILKDPGYDVSVPIARYDVFYDGNKDYKFCEFNTDGSSAMLEDKALANLFKQTKGYQELEKKYNIENKDLLEPLVDEILSIYKKINNKKPNVVIADIIEHDNIEFLYFKELFEKRGINCKIADIREFEKREDGSYVKDMKVDLVYRRLVTSDLLEYKEKAKDFIEGYLDSDFIAIGSFRSTLFYSKDIFRILRLNETKKVLNDKEIDYIERHIPFTEKFNYEKDFNTIIEDKDNYILKPVYGYASSGVIAGKDHSKEELEEILEKIKDQKYIYQEYYNVEPMKYVIFGNKKAKLEDFSFVTGLFIYNKKFISPYTRIGQAALISSARDYYTIPAMKLYKKDLTN
ncbi:MAG: glutathionylspermidine synthase family protein [Tissierellia bacterium]|nr:glutathionylspermidine synthase family protein [Tissierellia bacterium]